MTCWSPSRSRPDSTALAGRSTVAVKPGTLRQPSSSSCMPSRATNSGLMQTRSSSDRRPDRDVDDEDAQRHADLRRRQPDARRGIHRRDHVVDELLDLRRDLADRAAGRCSTSLAVLDDGPEHRGVASAIGRSVPGREPREERTGPARRRRWRRPRARCPPGCRRRTSRGTRRPATRLTIASPTTAAAVTAQTSLRSIAAGDSVERVRSTERSGFISVAIGFM